MTTLPVLTVPSRDVLTKTDMRRLTARVGSDIESVGVDVTQVVQVMGGATPGDGGGGHVRRISSGTGHVQSADGAWWEVIPEDGRVNAMMFGMVGDGTTDNRTNWEVFRAYLASENVTGFMPAGNYYMSGTAETAPAAGPVTIVGAGRGVTTITGPGQGSGEFMRVNGDTDVSGVRITAFAEVFEFIGAGDFRLTDMQADTCDYLIRGSIDAEDFIIRGNVFYDFDGALILRGTSTITGRAEFSGNIVSDIQRYVYRLSHTAPLYFHNNKISNVHCDDYTGTSAVARIVMSGSEVANFIDRNEIRDVVSTDADCVLIYWSFGDAIITNNVFGKFDSDDDTYLVKEKSTFAKSLTLVGNTFLGGDDASEWNDVVYRLTDRTVSETPDIVADNVFKELKGGSLIQFFQSSDASGQVGPGHMIVERNMIYELNAASFVSCVHSVVGLTIRNNVCYRHHNTGDYALTGTTKIKAIFGVYQSASYSNVRDVLIEGNVWTFDDTGESTVRESGIIGFTGLASAPSGGAEVEARNNRIEGAHSIVRSIGTVGGLKAFVTYTRAKGGLSDTRIGGLTAAKALITLTETGAWTESSGAWTYDDAVTVTATTGTLPTADKSVAIANAASPTNAELLELCIELKAAIDAR